jgi:hypothetical protein
MQDFAEHDVVHLDLNASMFVGTLIETLCHRKNSEKGNGTSLSLKNQLVFFEGIKKEKQCSISNKSKQKNSVYQNSKVE